MRYLHTMVRVKDLEPALDFWCAKLGLVEISRQENEKGRYTLVFLAAPEDADMARERKAPMVELTPQLGNRRLRRGPQFRAPGLPGEGCLRRLPQADGRGRDH